MVRTSLRAGGFLVLVFLFGSAAAQDFPSKPVRIVTSGVGGGPDTHARLLGPAMSATLKQPFVIDNRSGGGAAQAQALLNAPADGYTTLLAGVGVLIFPLMENAAYHPVNDMAVITQVDASPSVLAVNPSLPVNSVKELIAYARARPGQVNYGAAGVGGSSNISMELFKSLTGTNLVYVPYKTSPSTILATMSNEVQVVFHDPDQVIPQAKAGKLKLLAVTSARRTPLAPDLPTVAEAGVPGYEYVSNNALYTNAKTPPAAIARLNEAAVRYLRSPGARENFLNRFTEPVGNSPAEAAASVRTTYEKMAKLVKEANLKGR